MRIFTLGKNGIPLFLFALILFSGNFSSYGQCATVSDPTQSFCDSSNFQVQDLVAEQADVEWYADATSTTPLPITQVLEDGENYYAAVPGQTCARVEVTVTVVSAPDVLGIYPINRSKLSKNKEFEPSLPRLDFCVVDVNNPDIYLSDIRTSADTITGSNIQWYASENSTVVLDASTTELQNGVTYWVDQANPDTGCRSSREKVTIYLNSEAAPDGPATQTFCLSDAPTLADIEASGTNNYYTVPTGGDQLGANTVIPEGTSTYFLSSVGPNCESSVRLEVEVIVTPVAIVQETQELCGSVGTGNTSGAPTVADLTPSGATWFADAALTTSIASTVELVDGTAYYFVPDAAACSVTEVTVDIVPTPNAGMTSSATFCENAGVIDLLPYIQPSPALGAPDTNGTFNNTNFTGTEFDPADLGPGTYTLTYTVASIGSCPEDTSRFTLTITEAPEAGADITETVCSALFEDPAALQAQFAGYLAGRDLTGTFDLNLTPTVETYTAEQVGGLLYAQYLGGATSFSVTYNLADANCPDSAQINLTIINAPDAGDGGSIQLVKDTTNTTTLEDANTGTPVTGGVWTDADGNTVQGDLAPQEAGTFTYTVTGTGCDGTATVTVLAAPIDCPVVTEAVQRYCENVDTERPDVSFLKPAGAVWYASADATDPLPADTILEDGAVYFAGNADGSCTERPSVTVDLFDTPNAGQTTFVSFCVNEAAVNLVDYITPSQLGPAYQGGRFSPALENNMFDPADFEPRDEAYTFRYIVEGNDDCPTDESRIYVTVLAAPNAGVDISEDFCVSSVDDLPTAAEFMAAYQDDGRDQTGTFNPSLETLAAAFLANPYGTFATEYSVTANGCTDTANLSVTVTEEVPAEAGEDVTATVCSTEGIVNLENFLTEDAILGGVFSAPYEDGTFDPSTAGTEAIVITYTVNEEVACVTGEDTTTITLTVIEGPNAGEDGSITLNVTDAPVNLFDSLGGSPDEGGTWTPGNANGDLDPSTLLAGTYDYVYTVTSDNDCVATATVTVTIEGEVICPQITNTEQSFCESILTGNDSRLPNISDLLPAGASWYASADATEALPASTVLVNGAVYFAGNSNGTCEARESVTVTLDDSPNAGATTQVTFCENGEAVDLLDHLNPSILGEPDLGGTFSPALASGGTIFNPAVDAAGTYKYTVQSTNDVCPADDAVIIITITEAANAGADQDLTFCSDQGPQNLFEFLAEGVSTNGTFAGLTDGIFDPAVDTAGSFVYTVEEATGTCAGTHTATFNISLSDAPAAPTATPFTACISAGATVAELSADGDNLLWYTDDTLATLADPADVLVTGTYYVTDTNAVGCESQATAVDVTITDAATPTLVSGGNVFCEFDNPTLADLEANINESGTITWYNAATDGTAISTSQSLENGVTYYASLTDSSTACESSVRLAVTVTLEDCPIVIPEAFSPNGDGINDRFEIEHLGQEYPNFTIEIYNRWGNIVFKGNANSPNWDGVSTESRSFGDDVVPVGVYFYIVNFNDGQTPPIQGRLYLSR